MLRHPQTKYRPFSPMSLPDRGWPDRVITAAPRWCSTDLRDGNQALVDPMDVARKRRFFDLLLRIGFKEIEIAFPAASQTEFDFVRLLIEQDLIPEDVTPQVLTQSRAELIERTFESLRGARQAIVHLYNATAPVFRRVVFGQDEAGTIALAVSGTRLIRARAEAAPQTRWTYEYSPETFCFTEPDFALEVCERVIEAWDPSPARPMILNLPATVEVATPNVYADQIEWICRHLSRRDAVTISVHPHNDRGTAVAAAELAVMAGADRVEGCVFGHGERTGNVDLVTLALNLYTQGVDPGLDFSDMRAVVRTIEDCTRIGVHPRHPYAGELVFTAFSGSHQDAIRKGFAARASGNDATWEVPYLPVDPADLGCSYEAVIRVNSQSGKGGVAWVLEQEQGLRLPRRLQVAFSRVVQAATDASGREMAAADIVALFRRTYGLEGEKRLALAGYTLAPPGRKGGSRRFSGRVVLDGRMLVIAGEGNGPLSGLADALARDAGLRLDVVDYQEHAIGQGVQAMAAAYVECALPDGRIVFGVGIDADSASASIEAFIGAANAALSSPAG
ncbi:2-isopropylmalate synthase 2 [Rhodovastum atsumiense]|uniref:2-isopropylmalate synthase n=1 Tax=Rhodovastum atsumiense TaxID=504468 RepID=A0A5M6IL47_9PROT|nr:2-isopropylmalate synthase [Rhodovastum atsumiense]KAA5608892.1 2-isopropylmalate synthase [Rhodovastum atsumiense]CAH2602308.1 2-isopropylmalate synthase 2 [Rhodovastum atsumiense]